MLGSGKNYTNIVNHYSDIDILQNLTHARFITQVTSRDSPPHPIAEDKTPLDQTAAQTGKFGFIGKSLAMQDVLRLVALAAKSRAPRLYWRRIRHRQGIGRPGHSPPKPPRRPKFRRA